MSDYPLPVSHVIDPSTSASERVTFLEKLHGWVVTVDHKRLGILYILYSTLFLLVAGAEALMIRIQLAYPHNHALSAQVYNRFFTMHGTTMVFLVGMPFLFGFGTLGTAINIIATIISMRCKGMTLMRMPLFTWLLLVVSMLTLVTITPLTAAQFMLLIDRYLGGHFFDTQAGGSSLIWIHFFWIFGHPEVYVLVLPAFAIANEIIPVFCRK